MDTFDESESMGPGGPAQPSGGREEAVPDDLATLFVPRMMLVHGPHLCGLEEGVTSQEQGLSIASLTAEFASVVLTEGFIAASRYVDKLCREGFGQDTILLELIPAAAREIGARWESDEASFVDVSLGLGDLHRLIRERRWASGCPVATDSRGAPFGVVVATLGGDQHTLGASIVAEVFREAAWAVVVGAGLEPASLKDLLATSPTSVLALSASRQINIADVRSEIAGYRNAAIGPLTVIVGGSAFPDPRSALDCGADGWSADAANAPEIASSLHQLAKFHS